MATRQNDSSWMISQLLTAAEKFTFADGKADIDETKALIGLVHPFSAKDNDLALFEKLLVAIAEDGVVTSDESAALARAIARLRDKYRAGEAVYDARTLGIPKMAVLGVQHMFAMFGATILVPILTGLSPSATLLWAGLGTLLFHLLTKRIVPAFLGSSFAYLAGYFALAGMAGTAGFEDCDKTKMLQYACLGVASSSLLYFIVSGFVKACGVKTSIDVVSENSDRFARIVAPALKYVDYLTFNEIEAGKTVGIELRRPDGSLAEDRIEDVLRKLFVIGTGEWVIIHCPEGAFGLSRNGTYAVERSKALPKGYKVGSVGAGDAFCAGVLLAAYRGLSISEALVYGNASAQVSLRHASASGGMTTIDEALAEYRRY